MKSNMHLLNGKLTRRYIAVGQIVQIILGNDFSDFEFEVKVKGRMIYFL